MNAPTRLLVPRAKLPEVEALLVAGAGLPVSGRDVLEAFAVRSEVLIRVGQVMGFRHYALGFPA